MHTTDTTQIFTTFGGYVPEHHETERLPHFAQRDTDRIVESLTVSMFDEMMASLRSALSLR
jgi:hypothetical protein